MGLKVAVDFRGTPCPEAYMGVAQITGSAKGGWNATVQVFSSKAAKDARKEELMRFQVSSTPTRPNDPFGGNGGPPQLGDVLEQPLVDGDTSQPYAMIYNRLAAIYPKAERCD